MFASQRLWQSKKVSVVFSIHIVSKALRIHIISQSENPISQIQKREKIHLVS